MKKDIINNLISHQMKEIKKSNFILSSLAEKLLQEYSPKEEVAEATPIEATSEESEPKL